MKGCTHYTGKVKTVFLDITALYNNNTIILLLYIPISRLYYGDFPMILLTLNYGVICNKLVRYLHYTYYKYRPLTGNIYK